MAAHARDMMEWAARRAHAATNYNLIGKNSTAPATHFNYLIVISTTD